MTSVTFDGVTFDEADFADSGYLDPVTVDGTAYPRWQALFVAARNEIDKRANAAAAVSLPYTFSTTTTDSDPGSGVLRLNNATQSSATVIYVDDEDENGNDVSALIATFDDSTSSNKGTVALRHRTDETKFLVFSMSALTDATGYTKLTVSNVVASGSTPFSASDEVMMSFSRTGDKGDTGSVSSAGDGSAASPAITFTADPDTGLYRIGANNAGFAAGGSKVLDIGTGGVTVTGTAAADVVDAQQLSQGWHTAPMPAAAFTALSSGGADGGTHTIAGASIPVWLFDTASDEGIVGIVPVPASLDTTKSWGVHVRHTTGSTGGTVTYTFSVAYQGNDGALGTTSFGTALPLTDTVIAADDLHGISGTGARPGGTPKPGGHAVIKITRDVSEDTHASDAAFIGADVLIPIGAGEDSGLTNGFLATSILDLRSLHLPLNGSDGATSTTDVSPQGHTVTFNGNAQLDTAWSAFGSASLLLDGTGDYLSIASHASLQMASSDFTIRCVIRPSDVSGSRTILTKGIVGSGTAEFWVGIENGNLRFYASSTGGAWNIASAIGSGAVAINTAYDVQLVRAGTAWLLFLNGVVVGSVSSASAMYAGSAGLIFGSTSGGGNNYAGHIDDIVILKNAALSITNGPVPTAAFPTS